jgi:hypothetical protein
MCFTELRGLLLHLGRLVVNGGGSLMRRHVPALMLLVLAIRSADSLKLSLGGADSNSDSNRSRRGQSSAGDDTPKHMHVWMPTGNMSGLKSRRSTASNLLTPVLTTILDEPGWRWNQRP